MNLTDLIDTANDLQAIYVLQRRERRAEYEALYGVKLRKLNKRNKPIPGTDEAVEVEG